MRPHRPSFQVAAAVALSIAACRAPGSTVVRAAAFAPATTTRAADTVELFGVGIFSTGLYELPPTFSPDGRTAFFTVSTPAYGRLHLIMESQLRNGRWSEPQVASFSGQYGDADPMFSPDGSKVFFLSRRPTTTGGQPRFDFDTWVVGRQGNGWGEPRHVPEASSPEAEHYVSPAADGSLYISSARGDARGLGDIYRVPMVDGRYGTPENVGPAINSPDHHDTTPYVAPDQSYIIFGSQGRRDGTANSIDLYVSFRNTDGSWSPARNLGPMVNTRRTEYCPIVSPDGRYLYFTSERGFSDRPLPRAVDTREWMTMLTEPGNGLGDTYRIEMRHILALRGG